MRDIKIYLQTNHHPVMLAILNGVIILCSVLLINNTKAIPNLQLIFFYVLLGISALITFKLNNDFIKSE